MVKTMKPAVALAVHCLEIITIKQIQSLETLNMLDLLEVLQVKMVDKAAITLLRPFGTMTQ